MEFGYEGWHGESIYISYIDDRIIIFYSSYYGYYGGTSGGGDIYTAYSINAVEDYFMANNKVRISDFIANPKDRRLLSLLRDKFNEYFEYSDIDNALYIEDCDFNISPNGTITFYYINHFPLEAPLEATFTFEELKPFIKRGSPLDYLFN